MFPNQNYSNIFHYLLFKKQKKTCSQIKITQRTVYSGRSLLLSDKAVEKQRQNKFRRGKIWNQCLNSRNKNIPQ